MIFNEIPQYDVPKEDNWYKWKGVKPPERQSHGIVDDEEHINALLKQNMAEHKCEWSQRGPEIFCDTGVSEHGKRIGTDVRLAGTDEKGEPILVPFGPVLRSQVGSA